MSEVLLLWAGGFTASATILVSTIYAMHERRRRLMAEKVLDSMVDEKIKADRERLEQKEALKNLRIYFPNFVFDAYRERMFGWLKARGEGEFNVADAAKQLDIPVARFRELLPTVSAILGGECERVEPKTDPQLPPPTVKITASPFTDDCAFDETEIPQERYRTARKYCHKCGAPVLGGANFCIECGEEL